MRIQLSEHFTYAKLLRFTFPSIVMMIFTSIYSVVDGVFVSNFAGKTPFAAVNLIMPLLIITGAPGFMVGTGGSAIVAKTMGQGKAELANRYFSFLVCAAAVGGAAVGWLGAVFARPIASALGAKGEILEYCVVYARIILAANPFYILQNVFQSFFVTAEKPSRGRPDEYRAGRPAGGRSPLGRGGGGHRHHPEPGGGRPDAHRLLPPEERQPPASDPSPL